jgi:hypothetical protein
VEAIGLEMMLPPTQAALGVLETVGIVDFGGRQLSAGEI